MTSAAAKLTKRWLLAAYDLHPHILTIAPRPEDARPSQLCPCGVQDNSLRKLPARDGMSTSSILRGASRGWFEFAIGEDRCALTRGEGEEGRAGVTVRRLEGCHGGQQPRPLVDRTPERGSAVADPPLPWSRCDHYPSLRVHRCGRWVDRASGLVAPVAKCAQRPTRWAQPCST